MTALPISAPLLLLLSGSLIPLFRQHASVFKLSLTVHGLCTALLGIAVPIALASGPFVLSIGAPETLNGIHLSFGAAEVLIAAFFSAIASAILWAARPAIAREIPAKRIPVFVMMCHLIHGAVLGILLTSHLFNGFILLELIALSSAVLIALKDKPDNLKAALRYLVYSSLGSGLVLMGIAILYDGTGFLTLSKLQNAVPELLLRQPHVIPSSLGLFTMGLGIKSALFPLHLWLPDAHSFAPTPASALLSSLVIKAPPLLLIKLVSGVYRPDIPSVGMILNLLAGTAAVGIVAASVMARSQGHLKRMIAYSSVSQIGYVFLGIGLGTPAGIAMALYHMLAHGLAKSCMFLSAGSFIEQTGCHTVADFKGIGREMPYTLGFFTLSAFSMVGIPMLPGFISKFSLALAAIHAGKYVFLAVILLSSLLNALYYFPIIINGYFGEENLRGKVPKSRVKPFRELLPLLALSILMVFAGVLSGRILHILQLGLYAG